MAAALALPCAALAQKPEDAGSKGKTKSAEKRAENGSRGSKRCAKNPKVGFAAQDTTLPSEQTFDLAGATKVTFGDGITDANGDGTVDATDLRSGTAYRVKLIGKVLKAKRNCTVSDSAAPAIRKIVIQLPEEQGEIETEQPAPQSQRHSGGRRPARGPPAPVPLCSSRAMTFM